MTGSAEKPEPDDEPEKGKKGKAHEITREKRQKKAAGAGIAGGETKAKSTSGGQRDRGTQAAKAARDANMREKTRTLQDGTTEGAARGPMESRAKPGSREQIGHRGLAR